jgi:tetratricopeptide (TPR) repeat protein
VEPIDPISFVEAVKPALARKDLQGLLCICKSRWSAADIISLLRSNCCDARKCAALALSYVGCPACLDPLSRQLKDPDPTVNQMAEHAMWAIWFRCGGTPEANHELTRGADAMNRREIDHAITHLNKAIQLDPKFAEAYNQRAIAYFLKEQFDRSIQDCKRTVELMPSHFGAWAGMGHCHAHEGRCREALECYEQAIQINPHLDGVNEALTELRACLGDESRS